MIEDRFKDSQTAQSSRMRGSFKDLKQKTGARRSSNDGPPKSASSSTLKARTLAVAKGISPSGKARQPKDVTQKAKKSIKKNEALLLGLY